MADAFDLLEGPDVTRLPKDEDSDVEADARELRLQGEMTIGSVNADFCGAAWRVSGLAPQDRLLLRTFDPP